MRSTLRKLNWVASQQFGVDIRRLVKSPLGLARYMRDLIKFTRSNTNSLRFQPCLHDWWEQAGAIDNEYFWQDLFVARMIHQRSPSRHVDVGSRLDGFVAHLATFMDVEVLDVRKLDVKVPGVVFRQADLMDSTALPEQCSPSVSCLHAIEHFGLGRYGDPINDKGLELGLANLSKIVEREGHLYLSCPIGDNVAYFNAHRAVHPHHIQSEAKKVQLELVEWWVFDSANKAILSQAQPPSSYETRSAETLAIYLFKKMG
jgi:hypothetical protein